MRFFEEGFEPVLKLDAITGQLIAAPHDRPPQPLLGVGDKTEREFLRDEALHQAFGIGEVLLPSADTTIRLGLGEIEMAGQS